jgi:hypothetical protein
MQARQWTGTLPRGKETTGYPVPDSSKKRRDEHPGPQGLGFFCVRERYYTCGPDQSV